jgi:hypothetical protein
MTALVLFLACCLLLGALLVRDHRIANERPTVTPAPVVPAAPYVPRHKGHMLEFHVPEAQVLDFLARHKGRVISSAPVAGGYSVTVDL